MAVSVCSCTLDHFDIVSTLPCPPSTTRAECFDAGTLEPASAGRGPALPDEAVGGSGGGGGTPSATPNGLSAGAETVPDAGVVLTPPTRVIDKLDLLFMIDNSVSMRDKQNVLGLVNTNLITALAEPPCVPLEEGPGFLAGAPCPDGQTRAFQPLTDIHVGIITSSLGDVGAGVACVGGETDDRAQLLGSLPRGILTGAAPDGFLRWTPESDAAAFNQSFQLLTYAVGESGCGWEMGLESWFRFLMDPYPVRELVRVACPGSGSDLPNCVQPATDADNRILLDDVLLAQRERFLRPDSLVAIVMLTDENDCSTPAGTQSWVPFAITDSRPMFRASSTCGDNPNHPCCYSCQIGVPDVCNEPLDAVCGADTPNRLPPEADGQNLRCFDQRRRFGSDFLFPTERYATALRSRQLCWSSLSLDPATCSWPEDIVDNPLYASGQRTPDDVFLTGIVGVPWQALASSVDARNRPLAADVLRFKSAAELGPGDWAQILGEPHESPPIPPMDPFMRESVTPRAGVLPGNAVNGREYDTASGTDTPDDLEYACIFPLPTPRRCDLIDPETGEACDCFAGSDTPLCEQLPGTSPPGTTQYWAKAYPGLRQLDVLRQYGANSVVASVCARKVLREDAAAPDFAYRPALNALVERLQQRLGAR
jgi:hypothetical protein